MGKYMRKRKASGKVAIMAGAGALLGVRMRSRTLTTLLRRKWEDDLSVANTKSELNMSGIDIAKMYRSS